ncbi:hypothetical protein CCMA1212_001035 [Trichoderma ghanense]|uniref:Uncharacterized protein n=1 Tax=Trichoderma ghanense TaxID=65468 RepID=A0ABY2HIH3_9HYPO
MQTRSCMEEQLARWSASWSNCRAFLPYINAPKARPASGAVGGWARTVTAQNRTRQTADWAMEQAGLRLSPASVAPTTTAKGTEAQTPGGKSVSVYPGGWQWREFREPEDAMQSEGDRMQDEPCYREAAAAARTSSLPRQAVREMASRLSLAPIRPRASHRITSRRIAPPGLNFDSSAHGVHVPRLQNCGVEAAALSINPTATGVSISQVPFAPDPFGAEIRDAGDPTLPESIDAAEALSQALSTGVCRAWASWSASGNTCN